jgi:hypothetical protein
MTFSIVACALEEQAWGVAVASKFPAVGSVVPWAQAGVGAVATQSFANTSFGPRGLALMQTGLSAPETLARLLEDDPDKELRQVGLVDAKGDSATFSGSCCFAWASGVAGKGYAIQGNILAGGKLSLRWKTFLIQKVICQHDSMPHSWLVTARVGINVDVNLPRFMLSNQRLVMAVILIAGWIIAWMITTIPLYG